MSTLRVSTIQDTAGSNSSTPSAIANGIAKAWVNFNGSGVVAIRAQYNVSSITDNGTGNYTVNFTTAMTNADYTAVTAVSHNAGTQLVVSCTTENYTATTLQIFASFAIGGTSGGYYDPSRVNVAVFR